MAHKWSIQSDHLGILSGLSTSRWYCWIIEWRICPVKACA